MDVIICSDIIYTTLYKTELNVYFPKNYLSA